jgi:hypothetical protein
MTKPSGLDEPPNHSLAPTQLPPQGDAHLPAISEVIELKSCPQRRAGTLA